MNFVIDKASRGFWCEFDANGRCVDLVESKKSDGPPGIGFVWVQEGVEELEIYKQAFESMAAQMIDPKMTGLEMAKMQLGIN
jgi:hypothetical protein